MKLVFLVLLGIFAAWLPATAHANAGIGLFSMSVPVLIVALIPAIFIEAPVLARGLKVRFARGLWLSFVANAASTVLGAILAIAADVAILMPFGSSGAEPSRVAFLLSLAPMFFVTWWIENAVVKRMQRDDPRPTRRATFIANAITYALMAVAIALLIPSGEGRATRPKVGEALNAIGVAKIEVAEHFQKHGRFPTSLSFAPESRYLRRLRLEENGRLVGELNFPDSPEIDGKSVVLEPRVEAGAIVEWRCRAPQGAEKYFPAVCR